MLDPDYVAILRPYLRYQPEDGELDENAELRSLGLDSMGSVALMVDLEDHFGTVLPDSRMTGDTFATARSLWTVVEEFRS